MTLGDGLYGEREEEQRLLERESVVLWGEREREYEGENERESKSASRSITACKRRSQVATGERGRVMYREIWKERDGNSSTRL